MCEKYPPKTNIMFLFPCGKCFFLLGLWRGFHSVTNTEKRIFSECLINVIINLYKFDSDQVEVECWIFPHQKSPSCFLTTPSGSRSRRSFQVNSWESVCAPSVTQSSERVSRMLSSGPVELTCVSCCAASMLVQKVKGLLYRLLKVPAADLQLSYTSLKVSPAGPLRSSVCLWIFGSSSWMNWTWPVLLQ